MRNSHRWIPIVLDVCTKQCRDWTVPGSSIFCDYHYTEQVHPSPSNLVTKTQYLGNIVFVIIIFTLKFTWGRGGSAFCLLCAGHDEWWELGSEEIVYNYTKQCRICHIWNIRGSSSTERVNLVRNIRNIHHTLVNLVYQEREGGRQKTPCGWCMNPSNCLSGTAPDSKRNVPHKAIWSPKFFPPPDQN